MTRCLLAYLLASQPILAVAHDLITAESAQTYLAAVSGLRKIIESREPAANRARAHVELGKTLDEIHDLLNRDLDAHGRVQGLPSNFLMSELKVRGSELSFAPDSKRFLANLHHYREALKLEPTGAVATEASLRLLQGTFYDSLTGDPSQPFTQTHAELSEHIRLGERLLKIPLQHHERGEVAFILAIYYVQGARSGSDVRERNDFANKARALAAEFLRSYPDSLRTATLVHLLDSLPAGR